ncbi:MULTISPECIES: cobalamin biosynthesis protein [Methanothermobacter]|uniref:Probable cobalamin biosynthesis protein CobD n=1 Tax=Methanothermobacter marburgensis (strain ATCC BAA-927 / DSM 2133 / JCM 14651 / NBRC 100331 / OCM 82 / Marburg) TaxID=79929 RepID=D9PYR6_METTM|nr:MULTISPECIES: cobalamin biosynthesis protein [Methanothermobacter]ADL59364.1 cobalamin biosynthesis protein CbiB [Methanothermobacter marburgensis str. Marburg]QEF94484.1 cobalamin biosynthesis protein [Methanothermobacter sp. KEPCO-1]QHN07633.1 cobalamin biosynthesis protein [Methanothermobacter sp. THM-2]WBF09850.1 cobalamin biosynthesis protein [Methanothermobacter marburgensis]
MNEIPVLLLAVSIDIIIGEPPTILHPVVHMGSIVAWMKGILSKTRLSGIIMTLVVVSVFTAPTLLIGYLNEPLYTLIAAVLLSTVISIRMLFTSALDVGRSLDDSIDEAREKLSYLVSRDTTTLTDEQILSATIETLTENLTDSVTAPLFYFILLGLPGAFLYRVVNTLDAMVGYLDDENRDLGWFPARLDDILNYIPSRVTGFMIVLAAFFLSMNWKNSLRVLLRDARRTPSPNSGFTMAAAAGALSVQLEKPGVYVLGDPREFLSTEKLKDALKLSSISLVLFIVSATGIMLVIP